MKTAFLDSSVLFSAVNSPSGGSSKLFILPKIKLVTSKVVLVETERNVRKKLLEHNLERFFVLVDKITIYDQPSFLVTLDRKHFMTKNVAHFLKPQKVLTPKELIELLEGK